MRILGVGADSGYTPGMNCPVCKTALMVLEHKSLEVDYCAACKGIWLDAGELELLLGDLGAACAFLRGGERTERGEQARRCPICLAKMEKETTRGPEPVTYDVCGKGHGLWFDAGELGVILEYGSSAPGGTAVADWLRDMFTAPGTVEAE